MSRPGARRLFLGHFLAFDWIGPHTGTVTWASAPASDWPGGILAAERRGEESRREKAACTKLSYGLIVKRCLAHRPRRLCDGEKL
ncbi:hypothetical protein chiPu_0011452 [Chiloscyllium punctatum]|uniref:Uncharacterized protein n=1 Tax=Chiloscyllium punctatum TaxID=137246 RepID=A0A401SRH1_CHIPU|nr:hypothetical protein [Chiloscyllium punctatum]